MFTPSRSPRLTITFFHIIMKSYSPEEVMAMTNRRQAAVDLFMQGYNCAQSLAGAFADVTGLDRDTVLRLASSFGGGMGRLR